MKSKGIFTHVRMDNMEALPYQMKVGWGVTKKESVTISKEIRV